MYFASLPRYTPRPLGAAAPLLFAEFVRLLLMWITWWNTEQTSQALDGRTPLEVWRAEPTPIEDGDRDLLHRFVPADDGRTHTLTEVGARWSKRTPPGSRMRT